MTENPLELGNRSWLLNWMNREEGRMKQSSVRECHNVDTVCKVSTLSKIKGWGCSGSWSRHCLLFEPDMELCSDLNWLMDFRRITFLNAMLRRSWFGLLFMIEIIIGLLPSRIYNRKCSRSWLRVLECQMKMGRERENTMMTLEVTDSSACFDI